MSRDATRAVQRSSSHPTLGCESDDHRSPMQGTIEMTEDPPMPDELLDEDARYASFFHQHPHATYALDRDGYYTDANQAALEMTGLTLAQLRRTHFSGVIHPDDVHLAQEGFERALTGEPLVIEARVRRDSGELVDFRTTGIPLIVDGEVVGVHGVTEDITEAKRLLRALEAANARLEVANAALEEAAAAKTLFLANVSHEIRTPLAAIMGATEILRETHLNPLSEQLACIIDRNGGRLLRLVDDLLTFSGIAAQRVQLELNAMDVRAVVDEIAARVIPWAESRGLAMNFDIDESVASTVVGDELRISQVVSSLVQNAIKFTATGVVDVRVTSHLATEQEKQDEAPRESWSSAWIEFHVTDTGIGIAPRPSGQHLRALHASGSLGDARARRGRTGPRGLPGPGRPDGRAATRRVRGRHRIDFRLPCPCGL